MCIMGQDRDRDGPPLEIYGPEGIRTWLRTCIRYSVSRIVPPYRVHELMDIPMAPEWSQGRYKNGRYFYALDKRGIGNGRNSHWGSQGLAGQDPISWISRAPMINFEPSSQFGEIEGGRDIYPKYDHPKCVDGAPIWEVEDEGDVKVYAAPMSHGVSLTNLSMIKTLPQISPLFPQIQNADFAFRSFFILFRRFHVWVM